MKMGIRTGFSIGLMIAGMVAGAPATSPILEPPPEHADALLTLFADPPNPYRIQFLLRTNDEVRPGEIEWQVRSIRQQGGGGVFSYCERLDGGAPEKFLTEWWYRVVDRTAAACAAEGLLYWGYDEEDWPSGTAGGLLLRQHPELTWKYIRPAEHRVTGPAPVDLAFIDEPLIAAVAFQLEDDALKPDTLVDLTDRYTEGRLRWDVPAGQWTIALYTAATGKVWNFSDYPDLMSQKAGQTFVDLVYKTHHDRVKRIPGASLTGFFTDEPSFSIANYPAGKQFPWVPAMPFSPDLPEAFKKHHGYDWRPLLPLLYHQAGSKSLQFRCQHWQTCSRLYCDNYFGQIYRFCDERGLVASGHVHVEENLMAHLTLQAGNILAIYKNMHVPGIDWIYPFQNPLPALVPKFATSMAHLKGRPRTWCESFAACGWGLTLRQAGRLVNWQHVNGINMQVPISYKYSLRGPSRSRFYTPGISYQQPYWDHFRAFADYEARLCLLAAGLGHVAPIALAYPSVELWANCWEHDLLNVRSHDYFQLGDLIRQAGYDYDVLDDDAIQQETQVRDGALATTTEKFQVLVLPPAEAVSRPTLARAIELVRDGGFVLIVGRLPKHSIEAGSDDREVVRLVRELLGPTCYEKVQEKKSFWNPVGKGRVGFAAVVEETPVLLREILAPDLTLPPEVHGFFAFHRRLADADLYLVLNRATSARSTAFTLAAQGRPEKWNPRTGRVEPVHDYEITPQGTRITLDFAADELVPLVLRPAAQDQLKGAPKTQETLKEIPIPGPFRFRTEQTMSRPHVSWNFSQADDRWTITTQPTFTPASQPTGVPETLPPGDWCDHGLVNFSGLGHYETDLEVESLPQGAQAVLDLGAAAVSAEVFVNDRSVGIVFCDPWRLDVTEALRAGRNRLRITVANTLANYYGQFKELEGGQRWNGGVEPEHKISGLLGPVTLRIIR